MSRKRIHGGALLAIAAGLCTSGCLADIVPGSDRLKRLSDDWTSPFIWAALVLVGLSAFAKVFWGIKYKEKPEEWPALADRAEFSALLGLLLLVLAITVA